jgi:SAM-dependent MidA family methyltransferase
MERALFDPQEGYYEGSPDTTGAHGDFATSVSVGPLFGELLAADLAARLEALEDETVRIVEAGAHDGRLAADILDALARNHPATLRRLTYTLLEPSPRRRAWQAATLRQAPMAPEWITDWSAWEPRAVAGVIFSNELLDAFPVHRLGWSAREQRWFEWGVDWQDDTRAFRWVRLPLTEGVSVHPLAPDLPPELRAILPDGFALERCPSAVAWWGAAADALRSGWLLTLDYGLEELDFFAPHRPEGTLRGYWRHRLVTDVLARPGQQDLTAHVNFTALRRAGEARGLRTEQFITQERFLVQVAQRRQRECPSWIDWTPARTRQFQTLVHPQHMGQAFRVLVQRRLSHDP